MRSHALVYRAAYIKDSVYKVKMSCRRVSSLASEIVNLTFCLLLLFTLNVAATGTMSDQFIDDCNLVQCPDAPACPADSYLKATSEEIDDPEDYDDLATNNPFAGVHIEALLPLHDERTAEQPQQLLLTETRSATKRAKRAVRSKRRAWKRDLTFLDIDMNGEEESLVKNCCTDYECVCQECVRAAQWPRCAPNEVAVEFSSAQGTPGSCCASYVCVQQWQCTDIEDTNKHNLDDVYWKDACTRCVCFGGEELCAEMCDKSAEQQPEPQHLHQHHHQQDEAQATNCYSDYLEQLMFDGETWLEDGDCSECSCVDGEKACITNFCAAVECKNPKKVVGKCCPVCVPEEVETVEAVEQQLELAEATTTLKATELTEPTTTMSTTTTMQSTMKTNSASVEAETETLLVSTTNTTTEATRTHNINATFVKELEYDTTTTITIAAVSEAVSTTTAVDATSTATPTISSMSDISSTTIASTASEEVDDFSTSTTVTSTVMADNAEGVTATTTKNTPSSEAITTSTSDTTIYVDGATSTPLADFTESDNFVALTNESSATSTTAATSSETFRESTATFSTTDVSESLATSSELFGKTASATSPATTLATSSETYSASFATSSSIDLDSSANTASAATSFITTTKTAAETTTSATSTKYYLHAEYSTAAPISPSFTDDYASSSISSSSPQTSTEFFTILPSSSATSAPNPLDSSPTHQQRQLVVSYSTSNDDDAFSTTTNNYANLNNNNMNPVPLLNAPQNMHRLFDELGSMVVVALALGSLFCIALGLIIRYTKNKKKIYSSIDSTLPNSETSLLSDTSNNTVLTV